MLKLRNNCHLQNAYVLYCCMYLKIKPVSKTYPCKRENEKRNSASRYVSVVLLLPFLQCTM